MTVPSSFKSLFLAVCCAVLGQGASAAWTYDSSTKNLTDGNWTFTKVDVADVNGVKGLKLSSQTAVSASDQTVLDFTGGATLVGTDTVYPVVACDKIQLFSQNKTITSFIAPDMTKVSSQMCQECTSLTKVELSPNFKDGSSNVFLGCSALADFSPLDFPKVTESLGNYFFQNCSSLGGVLILSNATEIGEGQLNGTAFTEVYAPKVTTVKKYGMNGMKNVTKITISGIGGAYANAIYTANASALSATSTRRISPTRTSGSPTTRRCRSSCSSATSAATSRRTRTATSPQSRAPAATSAGS